MKSRISRRDVSKALLAAPWVLRAQQAASKARIKIDTERVIGDIDPKIYGNFIEHLGRCIEGGVFDEGSPLSDANGFRSDVLDAVERLNVSILRWPGGNFSSNYHWMDGIGPRDQRPPRLEMAWGTVESNRFGTHEFMEYVEMLGAEPYFCANLGTGTWTEAQQWVEYCNSVAGHGHDPPAQAERPRATPGKSPTGDWAMRWTAPGRWAIAAPDDYGKFALEAAKLMKWTDPSIKLIAAGSSNLQQRLDWIGWNRTVLEYLKNHVDYLSLHMYVGNPANDFGDFLASSSSSTTRIKTAEGIIDARPCPADPQAAKSISPGTSGTSGIARAATGSAAAAFWKNTTTWKTRWSSPPSSTPSSITPTSSRSPTWRSW